MPEFRVCDSIDPMEDLHDKIIDCINEFLEIGIENISDVYEESFIVTALCNVMCTTLKYYYNLHEDREQAIKAIQQYLSQETIKKIELKIIK